MHGCARTDAAMHPQADEGFHPRRTAASGADPREGRYRTYGPGEGARHGARGAGRFLQGMGDAAQGRSVEAVPSARLRTNRRGDAPAGRRRAKKKGLGGYLLSRIAAVPSA